MPAESILLNVVNPAPATAVAASSPSSDQGFGELFDQALTAAEVLAGQADTIEGAVDAMALAALQTTIVPQVALANALAATVTTPVVTVNSELTVAAATTTPENTADLLGLGTMSIGAAANTNSDADTISGGEGSELLEGNAAADVPAVVIPTQMVPQQQVPTGAGAPSAALQEIYDAATIHGDGLDVLIDRAGLSLPAISEPAQLADPAFQQQLAAMLKQANGYSDSELKSAFAALNQALAKQGITPQQGQQAAPIAAGFTATFSEQQALRAAAANGAGGEKKAAFEITSRAVGASTPEKDAAFALLDTKALKDVETAAAPQQSSSTPTSLIQQPDGLLKDNASVTGTGQEVPGTENVIGIQTTTETSTKTARAETPPPLPAASQTPAPPAHEQVMVKIHQAVAEGNDKVTIQLDPVDLGKIDVTIDFKADGRAMLTVSADNKGTLDLLQRNIHELGRGLADNGIKADMSSLSFNLRGDNPQQQGSGEGSSKQKGGNGGGELAGAEIAPEARSRTWLLEDRLNIVI